jgi:tRNA(His) 5'-end guanylyltransferase
VEEFRENCVMQADASTQEGQDLRKQLQVYEKAIKQGAMFDARVFNIPKEEVTNCIYWRQLDASRNSVQMVGQANFSHKELQKKSCSDIQDMLMLQKGINWNDFPVCQKRGSCVVKISAEQEREECEEPSAEQGEECEESFALPMRSNWIIDNDIPIFKGEGREYIEKLVMVGE